MHVPKHTDFASKIKCMEGTGGSFIVGKKAEHLFLCGCQTRTAMFVFQSYFLIVCAVLPITREQETLLRGM